ncbi:MAG: hypothetical protein QOG80_2880, partial [Pseudonocardiales bacterium]|nr:hypothetical protein [Pseudonocardiales bacterium]
MIRTRTSMIGLAVAGVLLVAGCSGMAADLSSGAANGAAPGGAGFTTAPTAGPAGPTTAPNPVPNPVAAGAGSGKADSAKGGGTDLLSSRSLIRTAELTVRVASLSAADQVSRIVDAVRGQVDGDDRSSGDGATATLTLEVPPATLPAVLTKVAALGREKSRSLSTQDVTAQVVDVTSRVTSAKDSIERLRLLFTRAVKLGDIIALESELSQREADLESLQAQQRSLDAQTAMARVTVNLTTTGPVAAA